MGRKKKADKELEDSFEATKMRLREETTSSLISIAFFVLFIFFVLSDGHIDKAGRVGEQVYKIFSILFGKTGFWMLPTICIILSTSFIKSLQKSFGLMRLLGSTLFVISSLGIIDLVKNNEGGMVGGLLRRGLVSLFDTPLTAVIFVALGIVGILVIFDAPASLSWFINLFRNKKDEAEDEDAKLTAVVDNVIKENKEELKQQTKAIENTTKREAPEEGGISIKKRSSNLYKPFNPPPLSLLEKDRGKPEVGDIKANANLIKRTLQNFGIIVEMDEISIGPSVTRYALKPAEGVKLSKILALQNNLELALAAHPVRIEAPIPGKSLVGIEIPNSVKTTVGLASLISQKGYTDSEKPLMVSLGKSITGEAHFANLAKMPHALIAGATGSGKSVTIHTIVNSLLFRNSPENLKFIMIDPKRVELTLYNKIPHLLTPVITDVKKAIMALKWAGKEMDRRYDVLEKNKVRDIESYHKNIVEPTLEKSGSSEDENLPETMPYIVVIIDELADIMQAYPRELESAIVRLAQMSRAVGIHLLLSTQRPSVNVITGLIKANVPARIALQVASQFDSRTILDMAGAEKLLGAGDMLYMSGDMSKPIRLQSAYISETEVKKVTDYLATNSENEPPSEINLEAVETKNVVFGSMTDDNDDVDDDDLYEEARDTVIKTGKASTSFLQRKLRIGYARAARLVDILEERGVIGAGEGSKAREVLIKPENGVTEEDHDTENRLL